VGWSPAERLDWPDFLQRLPGICSFAPARHSLFDEVIRARRAAWASERHLSQDLKSCTDKLVLSLEDDAPSKRASIFLIDIMNPCGFCPALICRMRRR